MKRVVQSVTRLCMLATKLPIKSEQSDPVDIEGLRSQRGLGPSTRSCCVCVCARACVRASVCVSVCLLSSEPLTRWRPNLALCWYRSEFKESEHVPLLTR